jgi:hypothetical protein
MTLDAFLNHHKIAAAGLDFSIKKQKKQKTNMHQSSVNKIVSKFLHLVYTVRNFMCICLQH